MVNQQYSKITHLKINHIHILIDIIILNHYIIIENNFLNS